jgi:hypothetical protein
MRVRPDQLQRMGPVVELVTAAIPLLMSFLYRRCFAFLFFLVTLMPVALSAQDEPPLKKDQFMVPEPWLFVPTAAISILATDDTKTLYGGEAGIIYGRKDSGHGFLGISGFRFCADVANGFGTTVVGINGGVVLDNLFVVRLRGGIYNDLGRNTTLMFIPEFGFSHNGIICLTLGGMLPILGSNALEGSARLNLTWNMFTWD